MDDEHGGLARAHGWRTRLATNVETNSRTGETRGRAITRLHRAAYPAEAALFSNTTGEQMSTLVQEKKLRGARGERQ